MHLRLSPRPRHILPLRHQTLLTSRSINRKIPIERWLTGWNKWQRIKSRGKKKKARTWSKFESIKRESRSFNRPLAKNRLGRSPSRSWRMRRCHAVMRQNFSQLTRSGLRDIEGKHSFIVSISKNNDCKYPNWEVALSLRGISAKISIHSRWHCGLREEKHRYTRCS